jgi:erythronate-4-phosphate dehydrogenase
MAAVAAFAARHGRDLPVLHAPGSTAGGVADWVLAALLDAGALDGLPDAPPRVGIVGLGHCGRALAARLDRLGIPWIANDPPRQAAGDPGPWATADDLAGCDIVTLHVPLTEPGASPWPTRDMADAAFLARLAAGRTRWLANPSRGGVLEPRAALAAADAGCGPALLLDVFRDEPAPDPRIVVAARFTTPHVAGSVIEGRARAIETIRRPLARLLGVEAPPRPAPAPTPCPALPARPAASDLRAVLDGTGLGALGRAFQDAYSAAPAAHRGAVFTRIRAAAMRREIAWPIPPSGAAAAFDNPAVVVENGVTCRSEASERRP